jgi:RNA polymerase sigma factor (TIGR02999 family)
VADAGEVTQLLLAFREGDREAFARLVPLIYDDLRRIARSHLRRSGGGRTLNTTGLVHEAYLRLVDRTRANWEDRNHFLSVCAVAMRQIVISDARRRAAAKRGGGDRQVTLDEGRISADRDAEWLLALDRALDRLAERHERLARVIECRYFAGLTEQETADALGASLRTIQRDWTRARAWLREELGGRPGDDESARVGK